MLSMNAVASAMSCLKRRCKSQAAQAVLSAAEKFEYAVLENMKFFHVRFWRESDHSTKARSRCRSILK
jgi:hypothetical protein